MSATTSHLVQNSYQVNVESTQKVWVLHVILLFLNYLTAGESAKAGINAGLIQPIHFENALTSNLSQKTCYFGEVLLLFLQEMRGYGFILG